jgi:hypothetical protein
VYSKSLTNVQIVHYCNFNFFICKYLHPDTDRDKGCVCCDISGTHCDAADAMCYSIDGVASGDEDGEADEDAACQVDAFTRTSRGCTCPPAEHLTTVTPLDPGFRVPNSTCECCTAEGYACASLGIYVYRCVDEHSLDHMADCKAYLPPTVASELPSSICKFHSIHFFLGACMNLYKNLCNLVGWSVRPSVGSYIALNAFFSVCGRIDLKFGGVLHIDLLFLFLFFLISSSNSSFSS